MSNKRALDILLAIEMTPSTIYSTMHNAAKNIHTFYMKNTQEVKKRQLALTKLHQIIFRLSVRERKILIPVKRGRVSIPCIHSMLVTPMNALYSKLYRQPMSTYYGMRGSVTRTQA